MQSASQARLIEALNPLIAGWVAYYNGVVPAGMMQRYDQVLEQRLLTWAGRRHPGKTRDWLLGRYWQRTASGSRVFATPDGLSLRLYRQAPILKR